MIQQKPCLSVSLSFHEFFFVTLFHTCIFFQSSVGQYWRQFRASRWHYFTPWHARLLTFDSKRLRKSLWTCQWPTGPIVIRIRNWIGPDRSWRSGRLTIINEKIQTLFLLRDIQDFFMHYTYYCGIILSSSIATFICFKDKHTLFLSFGIYFFLKWFIQGCMLTKSPDKI